MHVAQVFEGPSLSYIVHMYTTEPAQGHEILFIEPKPVIRPAQCDAAL